MKRLLCATIAMAWAALGHSQAPDLSKMDFVLKSVPDGPVAKVNGESIPRETFIEAYTNEINRLVALAGPEKVTDEVRLDVCFMTVGLLIQDELLYQEAVEGGMSVAVADLEKAWETYISRMQQRLAGAGQRTPTEEQILQQAGVSKTEALDRLKRRVLIDKMRAKITQGAGVTVSDTELEEAYAQSKEQLVRPDLFHLKQIYVSPKGTAGVESEKTRAAARRKIERALNNVYSGQRFEKVAQEFSDAPDRGRGGDMGVMPAEHLPEFLVEAAETLQPNEISDIIESEYGYHIIKLVKFEPGSEPTLEKAEPFLRDQVLSAKGDEVVRAHCDELMNTEAEVLIFLELEKTMVAYPHLRQFLSKNK